MVSYSATEAASVRDGLRGELTGPAVFCDIGGGHATHLHRDRRAGSRSVNPSLNTMLRCGFTQVSSRVNLRIEEAR